MNLPKISKIVDIQTRYIGSRHYSYDLIADEYLSILRAIKLRNKYSGIILCTDRSYRLKYIDSNYDKSAELSRIIKSKLVRDNKDLLLGYSPVILDCNFILRYDLSSSTHSYSLDHNYSCLVLPTRLYFNKLNSKAKDNSDVYHDLLYNLIDLLSIMESDMISLYVNSSVYTLDLLSELIGITRSSPTILNKIEPDINLDILSKDLKVIRTYDPSSYYPTKYPDYYIVTKIVTKDWLISNLNHSDPLHILTKYKVNYTINSDNTISIYYLDYVKDSSIINSNRGVNCCV